SGARLGVEFFGNTYTTGSQKAPAVAMDALGDFVVTWQSPEDGNGYGIYAQRFKGSGERIGVEFLVNTYTPFDQVSPSVAAGGSLVVAWQGDFEDGNSTGIFMQVYRSACRASDQNGDGNVDVNDVFYLINHLFAGGP